MIRLAGPMKAALDRMAAEEKTANLAAYTMLLGVVLTLVSATIAAIATDGGATMETVQYLWKLYLGIAPR
jgi:hypothetical protein